MVEERLLHRVQPAVGSTYPLDCRHLVAGSLNCQGEARQHTPAVKVDGASSTLSDIAALLRAAEVQALAQRVEQRHTGLQLKMVRYAVDVQFDGKKGGLVGWSGCQTGDG